MMPTRIPFRQIEELINRFGTVPCFIGSLIALIAILVTMIIVNCYMNKNNKSK